MKPWKRAPRSASISMRLSANSVRGHNGCLVWNGARSTEGYGHLSVKGRSTLVHRLAWQEANGDIPAGMFVCHRCDNPSCLNPDHLFIGTPAANHIDMVIKRRKARLHGDKNPRAKLSFAKVAAIRRARGSNRSIGSAFGISHGHVSRIKRGVAWSKKDIRK